MNGKYIKEVGKNHVVETPVGDLEWVIISGQGKLNTLNDKYYYTATLVLPSDSQEAKDLCAEIDQFWEENKTKKFAKKDPKSLGYAPHKRPTGERDEADDMIYEETGNTAFMFKTETTFQDGNAKKITTFNSKGKEVNLGDRKVGNGSRGRINGVIKYYQQPSDAGTSLYLNAIQLSKFVEYVGGANFDSIDDEEGDGFEGVDDGTEGMEETGDDKTDSAETSTSRPRL